VNAPLIPHYFYVSDLPADLELRTNSQDIHEVMRDVGLDPDTDDYASVFVRYDEDGVPVEAYGCYYLVPKLHHRVYDLIDWEA